MKEIDFTKILASGNDFVIIGSKDIVFQKHQNLRLLAKKICDRKFGIGADGLILLENSKTADIKMHIFNPDGTEAEMCGNGVRGTSLWLKSKIKNQKSKFKIETKAGVMESRINGKNVRVKFNKPKDIELNIPIKINNHFLKVNFINTGVPHTVIFVEGLEKIDVRNLGRIIRYHKNFQPQGTNVDFVEIIGKDSIKIRTYERGVEDETLSCGTGAVASAVITTYKLQTSNYKRINVYTKSGEILKVYFKYKNNRFLNIWLEGKARIVYKGVYYVK